MENVSWVKKRSEADQQNLLPGPGREGAFPVRLPPSGGFTCAALGVSVSFLAGDQTQPPHD